MKSATRLSTRIILSIVLAAVLGFAGTVIAAPPAGPGVQVVVKGSVDDAITHLRKMVADSGMMVMGELHQGKVMSMTGLKLQSETIFIGSPTIGKDLFSAQPGVGLVVPIRVNVYADAQGQTVVSYTPPTQQLSAFHDPKVDTIATMLDDSFQKMVGMLAK